MRAASGRVVRGQRIARAGNGLTVGQRTGGYGLARGARSAGERCHNAVFVIQPWHEPCWDIGRRSALGEGKCGSNERRGCGNEPRTRLNGE